jgi:hypothetical protein
MHRPLNPNLRAHSGRFLFFAANPALFPDRTAADPGAQWRLMARLIRAAARMVPAR